MTTQNEGTKEEMLLLEDVTESDVDSFSVACPGCITSICQLDTPAVEGFDAVCPGCETALFPHNTLAVVGKPIEDVSEDEARVFTTKRWEEKLDAGIQQEQMVDLTTEGPVMGEVDVTDRIAKEHRWCAEDFGWGWSYEGNDE